MKKIFVLFLIVSSFVYSQEQLAYRTVITVDSTVTKNQLFNRVNNRLILLFGGTFKYERDVIISDSDQGIIKLKLSKPYHKGESFSNVAGDIEYIMTFLFKDSKVKIGLTDFRHIGNSSMGVILDTELYPYDNYKMFRKTMDKSWIKLREFLNAHQKEMISIGENMVKKPFETESNW